jgi:hypothetical protein
MDTSDLLRRALFTDQSPAWAEHFQERLTSCFSPSPTQTQLIFYASRSRQSSGSVNELAVDGIVAAKDTVNGEHGANQGADAPNNAPVNAHSTEECRQVLRVSLIGAHSQY